MDRKAPIAIFIYKRPDHLKRTLQTLIANRGFKPNRVTVFADGPKCDDDVPAVEGARKTAIDFLGPTARYVFADENQGLANSVIGGVKRLVSEQGRVIVLEDDLSLDRNFLSFMDLGLEHYRDFENIYQICGHQVALPSREGRYTPMVLPFTSTWGWATWERAWQHFDHAASGWEDLLSDKEKRRAFNLNGAYDYSTMLLRQMNGDIDSWGIRWYWSVFKRNGLSLFPPETLILNHGFDRHGTHGTGVLRRFGSGRLNIEESEPDLSRTNVILPQPVLDDVVYKSVQEAHRKANGGNVGAFADYLKRFAYLSKKRLQA